MAATQFQDPKAQELEQREEAAIGKLPTMNDQPVIVTQPQIVVTTQQANKNYWQTNLCDCCSDFEVCLCGMCCFPCLTCQVSSAMNECCCCGPTVAMRSVFRTKYGIPGSICEDTCTVWCCPIFSLCQIQRDINIRKQMGIF